MKLRAAQIVDLSTILSWAPDERACRLWAGPKLRVPTTAESAWAKIGASEKNAYVLVGPERAVVGFGQVLAHRSETVHIARLIVDPQFRGQGIGRRLCIGLMDIGLTMHRPDRFTLNVYESNRAAIALYTSLGFEAQYKDSLGTIAMIKPLTTASTQAGFAVYAPKSAG